MIALTRRALLAGISLLTLRGELALAAGPTQPLSGFADPPRSASPWCYWYWISENISRHGLSRDLEAMRDVGIAEAFIGIIQEQAPPGPVKTLSEDWWGAVVHAIEEGARTNVDLGFFNSPGWSQSGGPWVKPEQAMRYVTSSELHVKGPQKLRTRMPQPTSLFQDVALLAFPAPREEGVRLKEARVIAEPLLPDAQKLLAAGGGAKSVFDPALVGSVSIMEGRAFLGRSEDGAGSQTIEFVTDRTFTARSLALTPLPVPMRAEVILSAGEPGTMKEVTRFTLDRRNAMKSTGPMVFGPVAVTFPQVSAKRFQLTLSRIGGDAGCGLAEVRLAAAPVMERYVEKQLGKLHQTPSPEWDSYSWRRQAEPERSDFAIDPDRVRDISARLSADGVLDWDVPAGDWIILRSGMTPTGVTNAPAPPAATGYEVDKMNATALAAHFDAYMGELLRRLPSAKAKSALKHVVADSYETGSQNWTDDFDRIFTSRYGYDPRRWLPVLTGRLVGSADRSERFLWDLRRLIADLIATNYVGALRKLSRERGLGLWLENYGHWGFPAEFLQYGGQSDQLGGEFWMQGDFTSEVAAPVSASALYGKPIVSAEAFTSGQPWLNHPRSLKKRGDWAFASGINHLVLHVNIHQPEDVGPGINAGFGTEFNRLNPWFVKSRPWVDYLRRTSFLLQQGVRVAELAYFIGEDTPSVIGPREPAPPEGFASIFINSEVIETSLKVADGRYILSGGTSFAVLVLPKVESMRPASLRAIRALVQAGGTVVGELPSRSPSLEHYPAADREVRQLAASLQQGVMKFTGEPNLETAITRANARPSVGAVPDGVIWSHRRASMGDIFYFSNQGEAPVAWQASVSATGSSTSICDPVTGGTASAVSTRTSGGRMLTKLALPVGGALFVVVSRSPVATDHASSISPTGHAGPPFIPVGNAPRQIREGTRQAVAGPWNVHFPTLEKPDRRFEKLVSWPDYPDRAVGFFSGSATYRTSIRIDEPVGLARRLLLDLGRVEVIASVRVNGTECGSVWCEPATLDITNAVKPGQNRIEVEVTNLWYNRLAGLVGDGPDTPGLTDRPQIAVKPDVDPKNLQASGLLGPVFIRSIELV